jgi:carbohydrate kinase (thermoresistant glucokinase family)
MRLVVMGVTGCGKSTVAAGAAAELGFPVADADDFHPASNVAKMAAGIPLTDEDRWPWLEAVGAWLGSRPDAVVACSALKRSYRDRLRSSVSGGAIVFVHLAAPQSVLAERVALRSATEGHFAGVDLLASQYEALEPLGFDEVGGTIDVSHLTASDVVREVTDLASLHDD